MQIQNARIASTYLGFEDHGIPTAWVNLDFGGTSRGFGGYDLRVYGIDFITLVLKVVGADSWENLKGKHVRAKYEKKDCGSISALGHILEDKWYSPEEEYKQRSKK